MNFDTSSFRSGFVALVGKPNVGKSTLMNALLGEKVAIVSPRPQTTRLPLRGILNRPTSQIVFVDTPGIHKPRHELGQVMVKLARRIIPESDVVCMMVDLSQAPTSLDARIAEELQNVKVPRLLLLNKLDVRPKKGPHQAAYQALGSWDMEIALSAHTGDGLPSLLEELENRLPQGTPLYPEDWIVDQNMQFLASEIVREKVLLLTQHEVPHAVAVEVDEWQEREETTYIRMTINVEKESQKGILIGAQGSMLKQIGSAARVEIEKMVDGPVYLDLWVKVRAGWRDNPSSLGWLG
jgi:GTP-binding protein Era